MSSQNSITLVPEHLQGEGKKAQVEADAPVAPTSEAIYDAVTVDMRDVGIIRAREDAATCIQVVYTAVRTLSIVSFSQAAYRLVGYSRSEFSRH